VPTHPQKVIDAHCHIGEIPPWKYYDLEHPVKPTVYDYADTKAFVKQHMDEFKVERALVMSNYGVPVHELSFDLNDVVMDAATTAMLMEPPRECCPTDGQSNDISRSAFPLGRMA